jgi:hypothetical protein
MRISAMPILQAMVKEKGMKAVLAVLADIAASHAEAGDELHWQNNEHIEAEDASTVADNLRADMF